MLYTKYLGEKSYNGHISKGRGLQAMASIVTFAHGREQFKFQKDLRDQWAFVYIILLLNFVFSHCSKR
jgi:hypothetical protein